LWKHAHVAYPKMPKPAGFGWETTQEDLLEVKWTQGDLMPQELVDVLEPSVYTPCEGSPSADVTQQVPDTDMDDEEVEEDYEMDNIIDVIFSDEEDEDED